MVWKAHPLVAALCGWMCLPPLLDLLMPLGETVLHTPRVFCVVHAGSDMSSSSGFIPRCWRKISAPGSHFTYHTHLHSLLCPLCTQVCPSPAKSPELVTSLQIVLLTSGCFSLVVSSRTLSSLFRSSSHGNRMLFILISFTSGHADLVASGLTSYLAVLGCCL